MRPNHDPRKTIIGKIRLINSPLSRCAYIGMSCAFVPHPYARNCWIRTDASVVFVDCPACDAKAGELCRGQQGDKRVGYTHFRRRDAYQAALRVRG